jgi:hypothetical protein
MFSAMEQTRVPFVLLFYIVGSLWSRCCHGLRAGRPDFDSKRGKNFACYAGPKPALGSIQHLVPSGGGWGMELPGLQFDHSPPCSVEVGYESGALPVTGCGGPSKYKKVKLFP